MCSDYSSEGDYEPYDECFVVETVDENVDEAIGLPGGDPVAAPAQVLPPGGDPQSHALAQAVQLRELEAKIDEERRGIRDLRNTLEGGNERRGTRAREAGRIARARINADDNVDNPLDLPRASQKLITAVALLRVMPEPATPEGRNLQHEAQALIELATTQQAESSASRMRQAPTSRVGGSAREGSSSVRTPQKGGRTQDPPVNEQHHNQDPRRVGEPTHAHHEQAPPKGAHQGTPPGHAWRSQRQ